MISKQNGLSKMRFSFLLQWILIGAISLAWVVGFTWGIRHLELREAMGDENTISGSASGRVGVTL